MRHQPIAEWDRRPRTSAWRRRNIAGERSGYLTAIEPIAVDIQGRVIWRCRCACGRTTRVMVSNFRAKSVRSCGCVTREHHAQRRIASLRRQLTAAIEHLQQILGHRPARYGSVGAR